MKPQLSILALGLLLSGCSRHTAEELRIFKNPLSGTDTTMRVVHLGNVEVIAPDDAPSSMTMVSVGGSPIAVVSCGTPAQCRVDVFDGKLITATVGASHDALGGMSIQYYGTAWSVWDHSGSGQVDTRIARGSDVVEIWVESAWRERRSTGSGPERKYFVGDREVTLTQTGWHFVGT
jgi:hypothetical protein